MNKSTKTKITWSVIITNLLIRNAILFFGAKGSSFSGTVNYPLMIGMSVACTVFYYLFFTYSKFYSFAKIKLLIVSILSGMVIIYFGNLMAIINYEMETEGVFELNLLPESIFMGFMGSLLMFPITVFMGLLNFGIILFFKSKD